MILLEWNINKRSNKNKQTPNFVIENILNTNADIICLVEYLHFFIGVYFSSKYIPTAKTQLIRVDSINKPIYISYCPINSNQI